MFRCRILTIGSFRRELFGWFERMENLMIQVSRCLGIWDLGIWVKIIGFLTSWQGGFWISCTYWTGTRDFCTRQIFKEFLDFLTGTRVFCICRTFKGTPDFLYKLNF
ncbi:unnamed protein product [Rhizophagus irregularis]|nr:unnamed protein product [Rhizophagus irregularis]